MDTINSETPRKRSYIPPEIEIKGFGDYIPPQVAKYGSVGYDLAIPNDVKVPAHSRVAVSLNFALNLPYGTEAKIEPRSGFSLRGFEGYGQKWVKTKLFGFIPWLKRVSGKQRFNADVKVGKIDPNYTDPIHVIIKNDDEEFLIKAGTRIAQMSFYKVASPIFIPVEELSCKSRGGGLGHSGTHRLPTTASD